MKKKTIFLLVASILILLCITGSTVYAFSPALQTLFANVLHLKVEDTSVIDKSINNSRITMSAVSSHVTGSTAVVMMAFTKDNGETFGNSLNPDKMNLTCGNLEVSPYMVRSGLSEDRKKLYCYFTWNSNRSLDGKIVKFEVYKLVCNESEVHGKTFSDQEITGKWLVDFKLRANNDDTITGVNYNLSKTVSMCGKELQINSVTVADLQVIVNTTTLKDIGETVDHLSSISTSSGMYYGVYVRVKYEDGSQTEKLECSLDDDGNIIAYSFNTLGGKKIKEVHVKDVVISIE